MVVIDSSHDSEKESYDYSNTGHKRTSETEQTYLNAKSALRKGEITVAQYNAIIDAIKYPGFHSRAADYDKFHNSPDVSMLDVMVDAAKDSPVLHDLAAGVDEVLGLGLSDVLNGDSSGSIFSPKLGKRSFGSGSGSRSGSSSASSVSGTYDDYLNMLHQEQERVWQREDTSYQRTVKDLQAAGLNPVLAVNGGLQPAGGSAGSDSQTVGAIADLAAMAISGLSETARGVSQIASIEASGGFLSKFGSWYQKNSGTIRNAANTAATLGRLFKMFG